MIESMSVATPGVRGDTAVHPRIRLLSPPQEVPITPWLATQIGLAAARDGSVSWSRVTYEMWGKRAVDLVVSASALVLLAPVMVLIALAIYLDSRGPILFNQERVGRDGRIFTVHKFRTMISDRRRDRQPIPFPDRRRSHKSRRDPRVTRVGRVLRATSLDELPQLWNVLVGEMSLVGPRPELPQIVANYQPWQHYRHLARPGVTGWWQVNGRSDRPLHENTELDIFYVEHQSLTLDLRILLKTVQVVVKGRGAF